MHKKFGVFHKRICNKLQMSWFHLPCAGRDVDKIIVEFAWGKNALKTSECDWNRALRRPGAQKILEFGCWGGHRAIVEYALSFRASFTSFAMQGLARTGSLDILPLVPCEDPNFNSLLNVSMKYIVASNHPEMTRWLKDRRACPFGSIILLEERRITKRNCRSRHHKR